jgi:toxin ParE1/3/4
MNFHIIYSAKASKDLKSIYDYIAGVLLEPTVAVKQIERIMTAIRSLESMPNRYKIYDKDTWKNIELRCLPVNNYLVFYYVESSTVNIARIFYGGMDISKQFSEIE